MRLITVTCLLALGCARFSPMDYGLESAHVVAISLDWSQTRKITRACRETNPIIGKCGQRLNVNVYMPLAMVLHGAATLLIPAGPWRTAWQGLTLGAEAATVVSNWREGVPP